MLLLDLQYSSVVLTILLISSSVCWTDQYQAEPTPVVIKISSVDNSLLYISSLNQGCGRLIGLYIDQLAGLATV